MAIDPAQAAAREDRRIRRLGPSPVCTGCGENDPRVLEGHHVVGRANDSDLIEIKCRNCHRKLTVEHLDLGVDMSPPRSILERAIAMLRGIAASLIANGHALRWLADGLERLLISLDDRFQGWRGMPAAGA